MTKTVNEKSLMLSIIVPIYNAEEYLLACLESIEAAIRDLEAEVLMIDDGSTDSSASLATTFAETHPRFRYHRKENGGPADAKNYGIARAKGKYLAFSDSDDLVAENMYRNMIESAEYHQADLTIVNLVRFDSKRIWGSGLHKRLFNGLDKTVTHISECDNLIYDTTAANRMIRRDFWERNGFAFPRGWLFEDMPVALELHCRAGRVAIVHEVGYLWRVRDGESASITQNNGNIRNLRHRLAMYERMFNFLREEAGDTHRLEALLKEKILSFDMVFYINEMETMEADGRQAYRDMICAFFDAHFRKEDLETLPVLSLQKYLYLLDGDFDDLARVIAYGRQDYTKAPITLRQGHYFFELPEVVFPVSKRICDDDYRWYTPTYYTSDIRCAGNDLIIEGHIYIPRITIQDPRDLKIQVSLLSKVSGKKFPVDTERFVNSKLTKIRGFVYDSRHKAAREYNYDGTGLRCTVDTDALLAETPEDGEYLVLAEYSHALCSGCVLLNERDDRQTDYSEGMTLPGTAGSVLVTHDASGNLKLCTKHGAGKAPADCAEEAAAFHVIELTTQDSVFCLTLQPPAERSILPCKARLFCHDELLAEDIVLAETEWTGGGELCFRADLAEVPSLYGGKRTLKVKAGGVETGILSRNNAKGRLTAGPLEVMLFGDRSDQLSLYVQTSWNENSNSADKRLYLKTERYPEYRKLPLAQECILLDSSKYSASEGPLRTFYEKLREEYPAYQCVWALWDDRFPVGEEGLRVRRNSDDYYRYLATARYLVSDLKVEQGFVARDGQVDFRIKKKSDGTEQFDRFKENYLARKGIVKRARNIVAWITAFRKKNRSN